jgi:hypothetical protein
VRLRPMVFHWRVDHPRWRLEERKSMQMESRAQLLGHPIHQMLIVFPLGLLAMAVVFDLLAIGLSQLHRSTPADSP